jgi:hypothetical protein
VSVNVVEELQKLGWTETESRAYVVLAGAELPLTGYEVAKRAHLTRPNVYAALERLVQRGAAVLTASNGHYQAVPFPEVASGWISSAAARIERIQENLPASPPQLSTVLGEGDEALSMHVRRLVANARSTLDAFVTRPQAEAFKDEWEEAARRGVTLRRVCLSACGRGCSSCPDSVRRWPEPFEQDWLMLVRDREETLLAVSCAARPMLLLTTMSPIPRISDVVCQLLVSPRAAQAKGALFDDLT